MVTRQQQALSGRAGHRSDAEAARFVPVISAPLSKRFCLSARDAAPDHRNLTMPVTGSWGSSRWREGTPAGGGKCCLNFLPPD